MGAAELALDWTPELERGAAHVAADQEPRLEVVPPKSERDARPVSTGFVYDGAAAGRALRAGLSRRYARTLPLPMEEVLLYVKSMDGQHVRRSADPSDKRAWRRIAVFLLAFAFGPRAWLRHSSYRQAALLEQRTTLREIQDHLRVRHAQAADLRRVMVRANGAGLEAPVPDHYVWQGPSFGEDAGAPAFAVVQAPAAAAAQ